MVWNLAPKLSHVPLDAVVDAAADEQRHDGAGERV